jgi:hypothetical protein
MIGTIGARGSLDCGMSVLGCAPPMVREWAVSAALPLSPRCPTGPRRPTARRMRLRFRSWMMVGALAQRIFGKHKIVGGIDQGNMRERLWKVADETLGLRVVFLR